MYTKTIVMSAWSILGAGIVACALFAASVAAKEVTVVIQVSTKGLDLSQPAGAHELYGRLIKNGCVDSLHAWQADRPAALPRPGRLL